MGRFLERIRIDRYGLFVDYEVGPFAPGLNVVYGANEAGKSTISSFIGGVLFGWEEARGVRNTYRPAEGERAGSLVFSDEGSGERFVLSRERNEDGLQGDARIVADIDHATFRSMFSLTSDELRSLRNTSDVTARLLSVGSGVGSSPAGAYVELEQRIAALTSRAEGADESVEGLIARAEAKRVQIEQAREVNELYKREDAEYAELMESRAAAAIRLDEMNDTVERLREARARLESIDAQLTARQDELDTLERERAAYLTEAQVEPEVIAQLAQLDSASERTLRDSLEEYADEQSKIQRAVDNARENSASSAAAYEALLEMDEGEAVRERSLQNRRSQMALAVLLPTAFVACGIPLFVHGRDINSLSFVALGIGIVIMACFMAAGALAVFLRPNRGAELLDERRSDAQWVMLQDKKKLDASQSVLASFEEDLCAFLESSGLGTANGSIRQARALLDDAREARARIAANDQRIASLDMRIDSARKAVVLGRETRADVAQRAGFAPDADAHELDAAIKERIDLRDALARTLDDMNVRAGELKQRLAAAREDHTFGQLKQEYQELRCRLAEAKQRLVVLLLAKRMLEKSIVAWESRSQPEVYARASQLFSQMTGGEWVRISMTGEGHLVATDVNSSVREVRHLSLGTCQQLYLCLRIALLERAETVGASIPVLADDILVNFDAARRRAAARALVDLAERRQVIVFTCHRETVEALREAGGNKISYLEL